MNRNSSKMEKPRADGPSDGEPPDHRHREILGEKEHDYVVFTREGGEEGSKRQHDRIIVVPGQAGREEKGTNMRYFC